MFSKTLPNYRYICQFQHTEFYPASIAIWIFCVWENALMVVEQQLPDYDGEPKLSFYAAWLVSSMLLRGTYYFPIDSNGKTTTKINKNRILLTSHLQNNGGGLQDDSCSILHPVPTTQTISTLQSLWWRRHAVTQPRHQASHSWPACVHHKHGET